MFLALRVFLSIVIIVVLMILVMRMVSVLFKKEIKFKGFMSLAVVALGLVITIALTNVPIENWIISFPTERAAFIYQHGNLSIDKMLMGKNSALIIYDSTEARGTALHEKIGNGWKLDMNKKVILETFESDSEYSYYVTAYVSSMTNDCYIIVEKMNVENILTGDTLIESASIYDSIGSNYKELGKSETSLDYYAIISKDAEKFNINIDGYTVDIDLTKEGIW